MRHAAASLRSLDKALAVVQDVTAKKVLGEARSALSALFGGTVPTVLQPTPARDSAPKNDHEETLLAYLLSSNSRLRMEQISAALGTDTAKLRPVMKRLIADGKVRTQGQRRGTTYSAL